MCCQEGKGFLAYSEWEEGGRSFRLQCRSNGASRFLRCSMTSTKTKKFVLVFLEGKGVPRGWCTLAMKLHSLRVVPPSQGSRGDAILAEVGEAILIQLEKREVLSRVQSLKSNLVGRWGGSWRPSA